jgi:hypothetical protein
MGAPFHSSLLNNGMTGKRGVAVPQLLYPDSKAVEWLLPQEKATFHGLIQGT